MKTVQLQMWTQPTWACCSVFSIPACFLDCVQLCERSVLWSLKTPRMSHRTQEVQQIRPSHNSNTSATGYLSGGRLSNCLAVIPGNEEMERDESRDCSSDVPSDLSMSGNTHRRLTETWPRLSSNHRGGGGEEANSTPNLTSGTDERTEILDVDLTF